MLANLKWKRKATEPDPDVVPLTSQQWTLRKSLRCWETRSTNKRAEAELSRPAKRRKLPRERRRVLIGRVLDVMRVGLPTYFAFEGSCRAGLRSEFCLQGYAWAEADATAMDIVATALRFLGAQRPTWQQGQPEWTEDGFSPIERTRCVHCGGSLPEGHTKFCDSVCSIAHRRQGAAKWGETMSRVERLSAWAAQTAKTKKERMEAYGITSQDWRNAYHSTLRSERRAEARGSRECRGCGKPFAAERNDAQYCSKRCQQNSWQQRKRGEAGDAGQQRRYEAAAVQQADMRRLSTRQCPICFSIFRVRNPSDVSITCSRSCGAYARIRGIQRPKPGFDPHAYVARPDAELRQTMEQTKPRVMATRNLWIVDRLAA